MPPFSGHCRIWTMHASLIQLRPHDHSTTRFRISTGGSWRDYRLQWQHPAKAPSALTKRLSVNCSISIGTSSGGNYGCSSHRFYLEGRLELVSSSWIPELPGSDAGWELAFLHTGDVRGEVTHYHIVLFDALLVRDFHFADCTTETLTIEFVV